MLAVIYYNRPRRASRALTGPARLEVVNAQAQPKLFAPGVYVSEQINEGEVATLKKHGFATIVDLRPDGEAVDQVPSATVERIARANQLSFFYVPVQHGTIPDSAVAALSNAILNGPQPVLVYCRSGRRAARTLSLSEASRSGGPDAAAILAMAQSVGQSADDLSGEINERIAHRKPLAEASR